MAEIPSTPIVPAQRFPLSDDTMVYDLTMHKYRLTAKCVVQELGVDLTASLSEGDAVNAPVIADRYLKKVSRTVYNYVYEQVWDKNYIERVMALYGPLRDTIRQMLLAQTEYVLDNGFVNQYSGVNLAKGTAMEPIDLRGRMKVADEVVQLSLQPIPGLGYPLAYAGRTPGVPACELYRGY